MDKFLVESMTRVTYWGEMFRLAHLSDIHLGPMPNVSWRDLLSKRITGYINWQRNRAAQFSPSVLNQLTVHLQNANPDHIVITGDLVNLALPVEIERAASWLKSLAAGKKMSIVCGNHDAYVNEMLEQAIVQWQEYLIGDEGAPVVDNGSFPILRHRGPCALILLNSALPTKPFDATGLFDQQQAEKLEQILHQQKKHCRVILIHHPPINGATKPAHRLINDDLFTDVIKITGAELVLHGHTHLDTCHWIEGPNSQIPVVCVPAAGQAIGGKKPPAQYNLFEIDGSANNWKISQSKFGYTPNAPSVVRLGKGRLLQYSG